MIVRETLDNGLRLVTEAIPHVRSVTFGVWLTRGSRHEPDAQAGIAHFVEHMLFKGSTSRSAEEIARAIDSIGGHMDAFTSKEYAGYYIKVLDEHLPRAVDILADLVLDPALRADDIEKEKKVILEEIKMVEDTPDDLVHELFARHFWEKHPLGRPILGEWDTIGAFTDELLRQYFQSAYVASNLVIAAAGNLSHQTTKALVLEAFARVRTDVVPVPSSPPAPVAALVTREKDLEQSHLCVGASSFPQDHADRYVCYVLNTILGGTMSSRLFQNVREKRGLAYAVFSSLSAYRDAGALTVYAGCASEAVPEVIRLIVEELKGMRDRVSDEELRRAKDHLKGSLMLSLENTSSRMSHLARQEIYFDAQYGLDETLRGIEAVTVEDVGRVARLLFADGGLNAMVLGPLSGASLSDDALSLDAA